MNRHLFGNGYLTFMGLLICTDLAFVGLHLAHLYTDLLPSTAYSIEQDKGHAEFFQYIKMAWLVMLLAIVCIRRVSLANFSWLMLFAYILLDDALSIHENFGLLAANVWSFTAQFGLRPQDWGELLITGLIGLVLLAPVAIAYLRADAREKAHSNKLILLLSTLVFFGVFIDMVHSLSGEDYWGMIEDGGEMLVISVSLYYVFRYCFETAALPLSEPNPIPSRIPASAPQASSGSSSSFQPAIASSVHPI